MHREAIAMSRGSLFVSGLLVSAGLGILLANPCRAVTIDAIEVLPASPTPSDEALVRTTLVYEHTGFTRSQSVVQTPDADSFLIDHVVFAPGIDIVQPVIVIEDVDSSLGMLDPGPYDYTVRLYVVPTPEQPPPGDPPTDPDWYTDFFVASKSGTFTVVPEPASLAVFAVAGLLCSRRRRARGCSPQESPGTRVRHGDSNR
jgi:hypothetical protein